MKVNFDTCKAVLVCVMQCIEQTKIDGFIGVRSFVTNLLLASFEMTVVMTLTSLVRVGKGLAPSKVPSFHVPFLLCYF